MNAETRENPLYVNLNYRKDIIRLAQNENPFGASPKVQEAILKNINHISLYPDVIHSDLKEKLALKNNVGPDEIIIAPGSCSIIDQLISRLVQPGENVVIAKLSFIAYRLCAQIYNRECREAEMENYSVSLNNILALTDEKTKLIFIANPNNPTGTYFNDTELHTFLDKIPSSTYVILDDAYNEYVNANDFPDVVSIYKQYKNVLVLRSFSKIYGLAGMRIGYGLLKKDLTTDFETYRIPFSVNSVANIAALAALNDTEFISVCAETNSREREFLCNNLSELGFNFVPTQSNFIFLYFSSVQERDRIYDLLYASSIIVRKMDSFGDNKALRISIGKPEANRLITDCLKKA